MTERMLLNVPEIALGNIKFQNILIGVISITLLLVNEAFARSELEVIKKNISANVIFLRHALAPGVGDPENFIKEDCSTQRNLNNKGRLQARFIGNYLRSTNLKFSQILTSEWCRCIDTARELNLGQWTTFSGLNSFFQEYQKKDQVMNKLQKKLNSLGYSDLALFVTHQVIISEQTGIVPRSGEMVLYNSITKQTARYMIDY